MYWMYNFWREAESRPKDSGYLLFLSPSCFSLLFPFLPNTRALLFNSLSSFLLTADYAIFLHKLKIFSESTPITVTANLFLSTWEKKQPLMAIQRPSPLPAEIGGFSESRSVTCAFLTAVSFIGVSGVCGWTGWTPGGMASGLKANYCCFTGPLACLCSYTKNVSCICSIWTIFKPYIRIK